MKHLGAKVTTVADQLEAELNAAGVKTQRRGAVLTRGPGTRAALVARRVPGRGVFGEPTDADALDATLRGLADQRVLFWEGRMPSLETRPSVYRFTHRNGVKVWVVAR